MFRQLRPPCQENSRQGLKCQTYPDRTWQVGLHRLDWVRSRRPCSTAWRWTRDWWDRWNSEIKLKFQLEMTQFSWYHLSNENVLQTKILFTLIIRIELIFENFIMNLKNLNIFDSDSSSLKWCLSITNRINKQSSKIFPLTHTSKTHNKVHRHLQWNVIQIMKLQNSDFYLNNFSPLLDGHRSVEPDVTVASEGAKLLEQIQSLSVVGHEDNLKD